MKVLVLHSELGVLRGGGENFTRNLFTRFAELGHSIDAAFVADCRGRYPIPLPSGMRPIPIRGWWSSSLGQSALSSIGRYLPREDRYRREWDRIQQAISWRVFRWHKKRFQRRIENEFSGRWEDFDAVYVHGDTLLASMAASHRPTVLRLPGPVTAELEPMLRRVHAVCANGDALVRIRSFLGGHASELPVGIDGQVFSPGESPLRIKLGWTKEDKVIGYVGRLSHLKGVDLLAAAFRNLSDIPSARLVIIGSGDEERNIRADLAEELGNGRVHLAGDVSHQRLPDWYRAMDLLVMPSRYENFSNALIEGMACGIPFVGSNVGGNRILASTGAGWLFEPGSFLSLSACLSEALNSGPELKLRGKMALDYVRSHHNWSVTAHRLEEIITSSIAENSHAGTN
jgi:glycosyltransferase involved in cell wall biosynthesis